MPKYRKKPIVIEAVQWTGENYDGVCAFVGHELTQITTNEGPLVIETLEGNMKAPPGWWIIKGVEGEFYPCDPNIFDKTYEPVKENLHV